MSKNTKLSFLLILHMIFFLRLEVKNCNGKYINHLLNFYQNIFKPLSLVIFVFVNVNLRKITA